MMPMTSSPQPHQGDRFRVVRSRAPAISGMKVDSRQQWMMIGPEHPGSPVVGMLVQPVDSGSLDHAGSIADQKVVQNQARQGVKCVAPGWNRRRHAESEPGLAQPAPGRLVASPPKIEVGAQNRRVVGHGGDEVAGLELPTSGPEPLMSGRTPGIEVRADQPDPPAGDRRRGGDSHPALEHERELDGVGVFQREGGEDRVPSIARQEAIAHGGRVAQAHHEGPGSVDHVFQGLATARQQPSAAALGQLGNGRVAAVGLLQQDDEAGLGVGAQVPQVSVSDEGDHVAQPPLSNPDIPAENYQGVDPRPPV